MATTTPRPPAVLDSPAEPDATPVHEDGTPLSEVEVHDRQKMGILFWICVVWLALNVLLAVFANLLPLPDPNYQNVNVINAGPGWGHLLGTDDLGRDLLSRLIYGARVSLVIAFGAIAIGMLIGGTAGLIAGYVRGTTETVFNGIALAFLAFPPLVAIMAAATFWGQTEWKITLVIGILASPLLFRVISASTLTYASREFVAAARCLGATRRRVIFRELLPNVLPAIVSFALIGVATVIILEGSLAFLGLSVQPPTPSWGNMINEGRGYLQNTPGQDNPWITLWPVLAIVTFLLALNFIGDKLRQRFDISEGRL